MAETIETDYSPLLPFADGNDGVRAHSSALSLLFGDIPKLQRDVLHLTNALKDIADGTGPEDFLSEGWGDATYPTGVENLPDQTLVPIIYISEGANLWMAPNNPDDFDLGDGTPGTGLSWFNIYTASTAQAAQYIRTSGNYTTTSGSPVDVDATNLDLAITTSGRDVRVSLTGWHNNDDGNGSTILYVDLDDGDETRKIVQLRSGGAVNGRDNASFSFVWAGLSAATHNFKLQWERNTAGTSTLYADNLIFDVREVDGQA